MPFILFSFLLFLSFSENPLEKEKKMQRRKNIETGRSPLFSPSLFPPEPAQSGPLTPSLALLLPRTDDRRHRHRPFSVATPPPHPRHTCSPPIKQQPGASPLSLTLAASFPFPLQPPLSSPLLLLCSFSFPSLTDFSRRSTTPMLPWKLPRRASKEELVFYAYVDYRWIRSWTRGSSSSSSSTSVREELQGRCFIYALHRRRVPQIPAAVVDFKHE